MASLLLEHNPHYIHYWSEHPRDGIFGVIKKKEKRKVYAGQRLRALMEGPLTGKLEASPEGPLNLH
eukprot:1154428-Pelagomonas_calceolata.AAC.1